MRLFAFRILLLPPRATSGLARRTKNLYLQTMDRRVVGRMRCRVSYRSKERMDPRTLREGREEYFHRRWGRRYPELIQWQVWDRGCHCRRLEHQESVRNQVPEGQTGLR